MRKLTGPELQELTTIVADAFSAGELQQLVQFTFAEDLYTEHTAPGTPFTTTAFELLTSLERKDKTAAFLKAVRDRRPGNVRLLDLLKSIDAELSGNVRDAVVRFNVQFQERRRQFLFLNAYKALHDALHYLQDLQEGIQQAVERFQKTPDDPLEMENIVEELQDLVQSAKASAVATEFPDDMDGWLESLDGTVAEMQRCLHPPAPAALPRCLEILRAVPTEQAGLNRELVRCAKRLKAAELVAMMDRILAELSRPSASKENELGARLDGFRSLCGQLAGRIIDHDACQNVATALNEAIGLAEVAPDRIAGWTGIRTAFEALASRRKDDAKAGRLVESVKLFEEAHAGGDARRTANEFARLTERFDRFFNEADKELLKVTDDLVREADLLEAILKRYL